MKLMLRTCKECVDVFVSSNPRQTRCTVCAKKTDNHRHKRPSRLVKPRFIAIDGEGEGDCYNLLGIGQNQYEWPNGLQTLDEVFTVLYDEFRGNPDAFFVGFFLTYDWNMWLKNVPVNRIEYLL